MLTAVQSGGGLMILAALICLIFIKDTGTVDATEAVRLDGCGGGPRESGRRQREPGAAGHPARGVRTERQSDRPRGALRLAGVGVSGLAEFRQLALEAI